MRGMFSVVSLASFNADHQRQAAERAVFSYARGLMERRVDADPRDLWEPIAWAEMLAGIVMGLSVLQQKPVIEYVGKLGVQGLSLIHI